MTQKVLRLLLASAAMPLLLATAGHASAGKTPFDGKIVTSHKRIPTTAKSKKAYFSKLRKQKRIQFQENKETKQWKIYYAAFFRKPLNDLEVTIKLYDVTDKKRHLKVSYETFLSSRGQENLISHIKLDREQFGVNREIWMVIEKRGRKLADGKFKIVGEAEKYKGVVEFTEEEANGP